MNNNKILKLSESHIVEMVNQCFKNIIAESGKQRMNDEGIKVPEKCDKCGADVGVYIQGEPVFKCYKCGKYFGTVPFPGK